MSDRLRNILLGLAAVAALAFGGAALAGAASGGDDGRAQAQGTERDDADEASERDDADEASERDDASDDTVSGDAARRARQAAAAEARGTAGDVEREDDGKAAYEVEVTRADGSQADVYLDDAYSVVKVDADDERDDDGGREDEQD